MKNLSILFLGFLTLLTGCETPVELDLEQSEPRLAVEAIVTDQPGLSYVKLSLSTPYAKVIEPEAVTNAEVTLTDHAGITSILTHTSGGVYQPDSTFRGVAGVKYTLTIRANGAEYTATSILPEGTTLDKMWIKYSDGQNDALGRKKGYYLSLAFQEIPGVKNYYKLDIRANGQLHQKSAGDILLMDDRLFDGSYLDDVDIHTVFDKGDTLDVHLLSLTPEAYAFYDALSGLSGQGGPFGRNPANLPTNLSNGAVGFFSASAVSTQSVIVK